jgi:hypothetical protein
LAMKERGEHLQIFDINQKKVPTLAQITLQLAEYHDESHDNANAVDWKKGWEEDVSKVNKFLAEVKNQGPPNPHLPRVSQFD